MNLRVSFSSVAEHPIFVSEDGDQVYTTGQYTTDFEHLKGPSAEKLKMISLPSPIKDLACGEHHTVALLKDGNIFSWGENSHGQLGVGDTNRRDFRHS